MKKMLFLFSISIHVCLAQYPPAPILQTVVAQELSLLSPALPTELLVARAQMSPQTPPQRESSAQVIARLTAHNKKQDEEIAHLLAHIQTLETKRKQDESQLVEKNSVIERLQESLRNTMKIATDQKNKNAEHQSEIEELRSLLNAATGKIASYEQFQEEQRKRMQEIIANGYKKLEQMRKSQSEKGVLP